MRPHIIKAFTGDPWEGIEMPEGFDPNANKFLKPANTPENTKWDMPGLHMKQKEWFDTIGGARPGSYLASMADIYELLKQYEGNEAEIQRLTAALKGNKIVTGSKVEYVVGSLDAYFSDRYRPSTGVVVPDDTEVELSRILRTDTGLAYMRTLLDTTDDAKTIMSTLSAFTTEASPTARTKISVSKPCLSNPRVEPLERCCTLLYETEFTTIGIAEHLYERGTALILSPLKRRNR